MLFNLIQLISSDKFTLERVERLVARPCPSGWEGIAASQVNGGGLGFNLLRDIDVRALVSSPRESAAASINQASLCEPGESPAFKLFLNIEQFLLSQALPEFP